MDIKDLLKDLSNPDDEVLSNTPARFVKVLQELIGAYKEPPPELRTFHCPEASGTLILKQDIRAASLCPHHLLPYILVADFAYVPNDYVVGLSKPGRLFRWVAGRLTLQEALGPLMLKEFMKQVDCRGAAIRVRGWHQCETIRGAKQSTVITTTLDSCGIFNGFDGISRDLKDTFIKLISNGKEQLW